MPWTAQCPKNETYVSSEPAVGTPWGEQGTENEVYTKNVRYSRVYSNSGEQIFALDGFPVFALFVIDSLWIGQAGESEVWV